MGGTFNPVHNGHLIMAESVMHSVEADGMLFIPARKHPLKPANEIESSYDDRKAMVVMAIDSNPQFRLEDGPEHSGYTIDLIDYLKHKYPHATFFLPIGSDIIDEFHKWYKYDEIEALISIVIAARPGHSDSRRTDGVLKSAEYVIIPQYDVASSTIRERVKNRMSIKYLVPESVELFIYSRGLYGE